MELTRDLAFGFRVLWKRPAFTTAAVLALALGVGATTTVFSAVDALLLRPLTYPSSERLVTVWEVHHESGQSKSDVSPVQFVAFRELAIFFSFRQFAYRSMNVVVRSELDGPALVERLKEEVWRLDPDLPLSDVRPLASDLGGAVAAERFLMVALVAFGVLALALAAVGTYGVLSLAAAERRREIAIRMALGARPTSVELELVRRGLTLTAAGVLVGAAFVLGSYLESFLFGVSAHDPASFALAALVLAATALVASYAPARRASRADPWTILRAE